MIFRTRGYLPHLETDGGTYFVTFRLADSLAQSVLDSIKWERVDIKRNAEAQNRSLTEYEERRIKYLQSRRIEEYRDRDIGQCWLKRPDIAETVVSALKHFDGLRYDLHAWCVMPNHVHCVFRAIASRNQNDSTLIPILHSWKSFTAHKANKILGRNGPFWMGEYYDHVIRSDDEFAHYVEYTLKNPVKAGLCAKWEEWPWSGCSDDLRKRLEGE